jgi:hypothetical protein
VTYPLWAGAGMLNRRKQRKRAPQEAQRKMSLPIKKARSSRVPRARERTRRDWQLGQQRSETWPRTIDFTAWPIGPSSLDY